MTKFYSYLNEKLIKINQKDIEMIYEPIKEYVNLINEYIKEVERGGEEQKIKSKRLDFLYHTKPGEVKDVITSGNLTSKKAQMAHEIKSVTIMVIPRLDESETNSYDPLRDTIKIGIPDDHIQAISWLMDVINDEKLKRLKYNLRPERIKTSIRHELTHWIDDALHGGHITKRLRKVLDAQKSGDNILAKIIYNQGEDISNLTDVEINAIVNQLDQVRKEFGKDLWNMLT
ncbi:MAG: hypothetical protein ACOCP4_00595 [Candidatus Woesearchaeota archaeon]